MASALDRHFAKMSGPKRRSRGNLANKRNLETEREEEKEEVEDGSVIEVDMEKSDEEAEKKIQEIEKSVDISKTCWTL